LLWILNTKTLVNGVWVGGDPWCCENKYKYNKFWAQYGWRREKEMKDEKKENWRVKERRKVGMCTRGFDFWPHNLVLFNHSSSSLIMCTSLVHSMVINGYIIGPLGWWILIMTTYIYNNSSLFVAFVWEVMSLIACGGNLSFSFDLLLRFTTSH